MDCKLITGYLFCRGLYVVPISNLLFIVYFVLYYRLSERYLLRFGDIIGGFCCGLALSVVCNLPQFDFSTERLPCSVKRFAFSLLY